MVDKASAEYHDAHAVTKLLAKDGSFSRIAPVVHVDLIKPVLKFGVTNFQKVVNFLRPIPWSYCIVDDTFFVVLPNGIPKLGRPPSESLALGFDNRQAGQKFISSIRAVEKRDRGLDGTNLDQ